MPTQNNQPPLPPRPNPEQQDFEPHTMTMDWNNKNYKPLYESDSTPPKPTTSEDKNQKK